VPIQNDQRFVDKIGVGSMLKSILNMRNLDTIKEWGEAGAAASACRFAGTA